MYILKIRTTSEVEIVNIEGEFREYLKNDINGSIERVKAKGLGQRYTMYVDGDGLQQGLESNYIGTMLYNSNEVGCKNNSISAYIYGNVYICVEINEDDELIDRPFKIKEYEEVFEILQAY